MTRQTRYESGEPGASAVGQTQRINRRFHRCGRDVDDTPEAAFAHAIDDRFDEINRGQHVGVDRLDPVVARPVAEIARWRAARIVDQDVDVWRGDEGGSSAFRCRDVARDRHDLNFRIECAQFAGRRLQRLSTARGDHDVHTLHDQRLRAAFAEAFTCRADQRPFAFDS